jgi:head-tail adaptor
VRQHRVPRRNEVKSQMRFEVTSDNHILSITDDLQTEADERNSTFATEQELHELAGAWPMKRLIAIWNSFPGVQGVQKFENRTIAIGRIWRAIQPETERNRETAGRPSPRTAGRTRIAFREGSKAAEVFTLLHRPGGATLDEIRTATGWQAHTVRGFISRTLRKQGRRVRSFRKDGQRVYRLKP